MPCDEVAGIVVGACGNPAIPACVNKLTPNDRLDLGYAIIFSSVTIAKILFADIHAGTEVMVVAIPAVVVSKRV